MPLLSLKRGSFGETRIGCDGIGAAYANQAESNQFVIVGGLIGRTVWPSLSL